MVDKALLSAKIAVVRDATMRVRAVLPRSADAFGADRTIREVVILNLFVAIQACLDLASHWLADAGWEMPRTYADVFAALAEHDVIPRRRAYAMASADLGELDAFCATIAKHASS